MHQLAFGWSAHGWITWLPGDPVEIEGEQGGIQPQASRRDRSLATGMAASHDDQVKTFCRGRAEAHIFIV
jgi:hypothetical protein